MLEFIIKYWIEILLTSFTTAIVYVIKEYIGLKNGMKSLLRNRKTWILCWYLCKCILVEYKIGYEYTEKI